MKYRSEFPHDARARVEAETLRAYAALEEDVRGIERWRRDVPFIRCVMRVFVAFAREACEFGKKSNHPDWSDRELDQRCRDFLLSIVIDAWEEKAKDLGIREMFSSSGWGYSIQEDDRRKIEKSPEWKQYQALLLDAFEAQSARAADCNLPAVDPGLQPTRAMDGCSGVVAESAADQHIREQTITVNGAVDGRETATEASSSKMLAPENASLRVLKTGKRRGRRPNQERRDAIRAAIRAHGGQWRDHLDDIFTDLDSQAVPLGDFQNMKIDLDEGKSTPVSTWPDLDLAAGAQRRQIVDVLRKYVN